MNQVVLEGRVTTSKAPTRSFRQLAPRLLNYAAKELKLAAQSNLSHGKPERGLQKSRGVGDLERHEDALKFYYFTMGFTPHEVWLAMESIFHLGRSFKEYERYLTGNLNRKKMNISKHEWREIYPYYCALTKIGRNIGIRINRNRLIDTKTINKNMARAVQPIVQAQLSQDVDRVLSSKPDQLFHTVNTPGSVFEIFDSGSVIPTFEIPNMILNKTPYRKLVMPLLRTCRLNIQRMNGRCMDIGTVAGSGYFRFVRKLLYILSNSLADYNDVDRILDKVMELGLRPSLKSILSMNEIAVMLACEPLAIILILRNDIEMVEHIMRVQPTTKISWLQLLTDIVICIRLRDSMKTHRTLMDTKNNLFCEHISLSAMNCILPLAEKYPLEDGAINCVNAIIRYQITLETAVQAALLIYYAIQTENLDSSILFRVFNPILDHTDIRMSFWRQNGRVSIISAVGSCSPDHQLRVLTLLGKLGLREVVCVYILYFLVIREASSAQYLWSLMKTSSGIEMVENSMPKNLYGLDTGFSTKDFDTVLEVASSEYLNPYDLEWDIYELLAEAEKYESQRLSGAYDADVCAKLLFISATWNAQIFHNFLLETFTRDHPDLMDQILNEALLKFGSEAAASGRTFGCEYRAIVAAPASPKSTEWIWSYVKTLVRMRPPRDTILGLIQCTFNNHSLWLLERLVLVCGSADILDTFDIFPEFQEAFIRKDVELARTAWKLLFKVTKLPEGNSISERLIVSKSNGALQPLPTSRRQDQDLMSELRRACTEPSHIDYCLSLIEEQVETGALQDVVRSNRLSLEGDTLMQLAATTGNSKIIQHLLDIDPVAKSQITRKYRRTPSPLSCAILSGSLEATRIMIANGANVNEHTECLPDIVKGLPLWYLKYGASPLHSAVLVGNIEITRLLLENGADMYRLDHVGKSDLLTNVIYRRERLEFQTAQGDEQFVWEVSGFRRKNLFERYKYGDNEGYCIRCGKAPRTAIEEAAMLGRLDILTLFLQLDISCRDLASEAASRTARETLVRYIKNFQPNSGNHSGRSGSRLVEDRGVGSMMPMEIDT